MDFIIILLANVDHCSPENIMVAPVLSNELLLQVPVNIRHDNRPMKHPRESRFYCTLTIVQCAAHPTPALPVGKITENIISLRGKLRRPPGRLGSGSIHRYPPPPASTSSAPLPKRNRYTKSSWASGKFPQHDFPVGALPCFLGHLFSHMTGGPESHNVCTTLFHAS